MAKYKVKVLGVQGINNKVYGPGAIVSDEMFPEGNAAKLAKEGKLELIEKAEKEQKVLKAKKEQVNES